MAQANRLASPGDMVRSLAVILIPLVIITVLFTDLPEDRPVTEVDWRPVLATARRDAPFPVLAPTNLPEGWRATQAEWVEVGEPHLDGQPSVRNLWQLGFLNPDDVFIGLDQGDLLRRGPGRPAEPGRHRRWGEHGQRPGLAAAGQSGRADPLAGPAGRQGDLHRLRRPAVRRPGGVRRHPVRLGLSQGLAGVWRTQDFCHYAGRMSLSKVSVVLVEPIAVFEFGVAVEVFGVDRSDDGVPPVDFRVCAEQPGVPLETKTSSPFTITATHGLDGGGRQRPGHRVGHDGPRPGMSTRLRC